MFGQTWPQGFLFCQDVHVAEQTFGKISVEVVGTYVLAAQCSRQVGFSFAMAGRASNSLSKQEYEKIVRANKVSVLKADLSLTLDELASKYAGLLKDLLDKTARVSKNSLCEALLAANESNDPQDSKHFAGRIVEAVSAGRQLAKSMTSGKKTSVGLKVVLLLLCQNALKLLLSFVQNALKLLLELPQEQLQVPSSHSWLASCQQFFHAATGWEFLFASPLQADLHWQRILQQQNHGRLDA